MPASPVVSYGLILREARLYFNLTQLQMAGWLGLSTTQVKRVEAEKDPLPRHARAWFWPWLQALHADPVPDPAPVPYRPDPEPPAGPAALRARLRECWFQAEVLRRRLAEHETRARYLRRRLAIGPRLAALLPPPGPDEPADAPAARRRRWLEGLLRDATWQLGESHPQTGPPALALLAARRHAWQQEAAWLEAHLAAGPPPAPPGQASPQEG